MGKAPFLLLLGLLSSLSFLQGGEPLRIACVGDSITAGTVLPEAKTESYPALLTRKLGAAAEVKNFGHSGATVTGGVEGAFPYKELPEYPEALAFQPDVVLIMLGTNDAKTSIWPSQQKNFFGEYKALVRSFRALPKPPRIILCQPVPVLGAGRFKITETNRMEVAAAVKQVAEELQFKLVDFDPLLKGKSEFYRDQVHPNAVGTALIADHLAEVLRPLVSLP